MSVNRMLKVYRETQRKSPSHVASRLSAASWAIIAATLTAGASIALHSSSIVRSAPVSAQPPVSLIELLSLSPERLAGVPITRMNLLCAQGLSGSAVPDFEACLGSVKAWAMRVQSETERHRYRFRQNPAEYEHSEGFFRMLMLAVVLAEDFGIHYSTQRKSDPANARADDGFFAEARDVFLTGLLGPEHQGTCSSLPVLYVAVGRELGYPLKLVTTKGHMFARWEGGGERFNVEATGQGLNRFDDEYYRHWPFEVTRAEEAAEGYLKPLTAPEELAVFLSIRGMCLREAGNVPEAAKAFAAAIHLAPTCQGYQMMLTNLESKLRPAIAKTKTLANTP
jgi:hypothetical protein